MNKLLNYYTIHSNSRAVLYIYINKIVMFVNRYQINNVLNEDDRDQME